MRKKQNRTRHDARRAVVQALFMRDQNRDTDIESIKQFIHDELRFPKLEVFALDLVAGVRDHIGEINEAITQSATNWSVDRLAVIDRAILRLGVYELLFCPQTPPKVAINEALELAKAFSTKESVAFLNGVLDQISKKGTAAPL